jgi:drug/metabolite transporter (DMT)-like permease
MTAPADARSGDRKEQLDSVAIASLLVCCLIWGLNQVATKVALVDIPPLTQAALRSLGAALLVLAWSRWRGIDLWARDGTWRAGCWIGALFAAEFACIFIGLQFTSASRMVVFVYLAPFMVAIGMRFVARGERLHPLQWLGMVIAFAGVAWAFSEAFAAGSAGGGAHQWWGDALGLAAAAFWAATTLTIRATTLAHAPAEKTLLYQLTVSAVLLALAAYGSGELWPQRIGAMALGSLAFQTLVVTFASYLLWFWLVRHYPATRLAAFTLLTPIAGLAAGVGLLGEPLTVRLGSAVLAVALGIALVSRR